MDRAGRSQENCDDLLAWNVRVLKGRPEQILVIMAVAAAAGVLGGWWSGHPLLGLLGFAMILGSTAEYWLGASYRLDSRGVTARVALSISAMSWRDVKRVEVGRKTIKLSPLASPSRTNPFRGVTLRMGPDLRQTALEFIQARCGPDTRFEEREPEPAR